MNSRPHNGRQKPKIFNPQDWMSRKRGKASKPKRDPAQSSQDLEKRLASFQRAQQKQLGNRPKDE